MEVIHICGVISKICHRFHDGRLVQNMLLIITCLITTHYIYIYIPCSIYGNMKIFPEIYRGNIIPTSYNKSIC